MTDPGEGFVLGVDLGTSHTVAILRRPDGRARPLLFDGQPLLPSAVYLDTTGRLHVGRDALRLGYAEPGRIEPHPKRRVDDGSVLLGEAAVPVSDLLAALLGAVAQEAVATAGFLPPAVLTFPASWGATRRQVLVEALGKAGWPRETRLTPEPVAAARYFADVLRRPVPAGAALAVFDFGGGTLDVAVVRNDGPGPDGRPRFAVTAAGGDDNLGGLDLDAALVDHLGKSLAGAEPQAWHALTDPSTLAQWRARRQFWEDVRGAKEMLSRSSFAPVPVPGVEHAVHLTRDELEAVADPLIRRGVAEAGAVIAAGGLAPAELAGLFLVGGSSRVPLVARLLHSELGIAPTVLEQPELPVAEGAILAEPAARPAEPPGPVRFTNGVATAATPTPTPPTAPGSPPPITGTRADRAAITPAPAESSPGAHPAVSPRRLPGEDSRAYAEPVDPWATGEAAALAVGGQAIYPDAHTGLPDKTHLSTQPGSPPADRLDDQLGAPPGPASTSEDRPRGEGSGRKRAYLMIAAAMTLVLAAGGVAAWYFWLGYRALDYRALTDVRRVPPAVPVSSSWSDAEVIGDRVYFASSDSETGAVGVVAIEAGAEKPTWTSTAAGTAATWESMVATPSGVVLFSAADSTTGKREMAVLGADHGNRIWHRSIGSEDEVLLAGNIAVLVDRTEHRLLGLRLSDGGTGWEQADPKTDLGTSTTVVAATTPADLAGPATAAGRPLQPDLGDDPRIVQISADRSARVLDGTTGVILKSRRSVADTNDEVIAHNDRLFVRESENAQRIVSYQLDKLGEPQFLYTAQAPNGGLSDLTACGDDRVCFVEKSGYDPKTAEVVAVDASKDDRIWHYPLAGTNKLVPVGTAVLASTSSDTTLIDANGRKVTTAGAVARLDGGNVLEFNKAPTGGIQDPYMVGQHLGDDPVQLGPLSDVRSETCSWNTSLVACVADEDFVMERFTK